MLDTGLENKVVLITGGNHGIGASTARAFGEQRAKVFITFYRPDANFSEAEMAEAKSAGVGNPVLYEANQQSSADPTIESIRALGGEAFAHETDLGDADNIPRIFDQCEAQLGPVDVLVNNHTHSVPETFDPSLAEETGVQRISETGIDRHFAVNTRACALMMSEYVGRLLDRGASWGRIINLSTDASDAHLSNVSYAASKHAVESYSRSAALELGKYGVTVNVVAPGPTQTGYITPEQEKHFLDRIPLGRLGQPQDIADVIIFLASQQAQWLTGQVIRAGGGWRM